MKYLEIIKKWGRLTSAQVSANAFYICYGEIKKRIEYSDASASVYINILTSEDIELLQQSLIEDTRYRIYPHKNEMEIWFY